jgi:competence protein ComFA
MRSVSFSLNKRLTIAPENPKNLTDRTPFPFCEPPYEETPPLDPSFPYDKTLQQVLSGRMLLLDEMPQTSATILDHYENGYVNVHPGIIKKKYGYACSRCGNDEEQLFASFSCYRCKSSHCVYCRNCIMMGRISMCTPLFSWTGPEVDWPKSKNELKWEGELSDGQQAASDRFVEQVGKRGELLIWAVCGAGKTEVLFRGIEKALKLGLRVCVATPRTDVVLELTPRFKRAFPNTLTASCYVGSTEKEIPAQLVLSTTHQLYRFKQAFELMIVDEVDAFPYSIDKTLQKAVSAATRHHASRIYLSATPSWKMKRAAARGDLPCVKIPKRFHGYPLPVPRSVWLGEWQKRVERGKLPSAFLRWVKSQAMMGRRAMVFVPSVSLLGKVTDLIRKNVQIRVESVHAEDLERKEKVAAFRDGDIQLLVTTTILERGVTVPFLDVAVFGADHELFSESALVQIAGRAGRNKEEPNGEVIFFHYGKSISMALAKRHIKMMNKEAGL